VREGDSNGDGWTGLEDGCQVACVPEDQFYTPEMKQVALHDYKDWHGLIESSPIDWVALADLVNTVAPTIGYLASAVCVVGGGPASPVGAVGCTSAVAVDLLVFSVNVGAAAACDRPGCGGQYLQSAAVGAIGVTIGASGSPSTARRFTGFVWDFGNWSGSSN